MLYLDELNNLIPRDKITTRKVVCVVSLSEFSTALNVGGEIIDDSAVESKDQHGAVEYWKEYFADINNLTCINGM